MIFDKFTAACVMLELSDKLLQNTDDYEDLFLALIYALFRWSRGRFPHTRALAYFFARIVERMGIFPAIGTCAVCGTKQPGDPAAFPWKKEGKSVGNAFHMWLPFLYPGPHF